MLKIIMIYDELLNWNFNTAVSTMTEEGETILIHDAPQVQSTAK